MAMARKFPRETERLEALIDASKVREEFGTIFFVDKCSKRTDKIEEDSIALCECAFESLICEIEALIAIRMYIQSFVRHRSE